MVQKYRDLGAFGIAALASRPRLSITRQMQHICMVSCLAGYFEGSF